MRDVVIKVGIALVIVCVLVASCDEVVTELPLTPVFLIPQLNFDLGDFIGEKVWVSGYYGDEGISGDGYGLLVTGFDMVLVDEKLPDHCCVLLDGELPGYSETGAEVMVYGEVKDFGETYDVFTLKPTALITVEEYHVLTPPVGATALLDSLLDVSLERAVPRVSSMAEESDVEYWGKKPTKYDRALILSGGVDEYNNHPRYRDNIIVTYLKLKELGFRDEQIAVLYYKGGNITMEIGVLQTEHITLNITTDEASKQKVEETLTKFKNEMEPDSTLLVFVTDHGTGYDPEKCWNGARPAALNMSREIGTTYREDAICVDLLKKVYRWAERSIANGKEFLFIGDAATPPHILVYMRQGGTWVLKGNDKDGNGKITELEVDEDLDSDGSKTGRFWRVATIGSWLEDPLKQKHNEWDTDGDGSVDVRAKWDITTWRYVIEQKVGNDWLKIGEDTNADYIIDKKDGGIDWNLDGDTDDQVGFYEGINLLGEEVLWDYELRDLLQPLYDKGVCILVQMDCCYSGGFIEQLKKAVEIAVAFAGEENPHLSRLDAATKRICAFDHKGFVDNLVGIDLASWEAAFEAAKKADEAQWKADGSITGEKNEYVKWKTDTPRRCQASVNFTDPILEEIIRTAIGIPLDIIYPSDLEGVTSLNASESCIADINGLEYCPNLEWVDLSSNRISDVWNLVSLTNLTYLDLSSNQISDISPLLQNEGLATYDVIDLRDNLLSPSSVSIYIPQLRERDMAVDYDCSSSAGWDHTVGLKCGGTVLAVGNNYNGQCNVGAWTGIVQVAAGGLHTVGLKSDGSVVAVGNNEVGQCNVGNWGDIIQVAAGDVHTVGLKSDGTVVALGYNDYGQCDVGGWTHIVQVAAGLYHTVGLKSDGTVVAVGENWAEQCNVGGWTNVIRVDAGGSHTVGLRCNGTAVAVGSNTAGQCNVSGWTGITQVAAGGAFTVGLKSDGTAVAVGYNKYGQCNVGGWTNITRVAAGIAHTVGLKSDGTVIAVGDNGDGQCNVGGWILR